MIRAGFDIRLGYPDMRYDASLINREQSWLVASITSEVVCLDADDGEWVRTL